MPNISEYLENIENAILGEDVRDSIHDAIEVMNDVVDQKSAEIDAKVGIPFTAATAAAMTDTTKIYVYTGSETGYETGHWYYYDGTEWVRGGAFNSPQYDYDDLYNKPPIVLVDDDEPEDDRTNIWFDTTETDEIEVPTMEEFEALSESIAEEYDSTKTYAVGDYCIYNDILYCCITAIATAEAWNSAHWNQVNVGAELSGINQDLSELSNNLVKANSVGLPNYMIGYSLNNSGEIIEDADFCVSEKIPVNGLFISCVFYYGTPNNPHTKICSYRSDDTLIDYWGASTGSEMRNVSNVGSECAYVRFSFNKGYDAKLTSVRNHVWWQAVELTAVNSSLFGKSPRRMIGSEIASSITDGTKIEIEQNAIKTFTAILYGKISSFGSIDIGHGDSGSYTEFVTVDNTNIYVTTAGSESDGVPHGLTIDEYIAIVLDVMYNCDWRLTIHTLNGTYSRTFTYPNAWIGNAGTLFAKMHSTTLTDVVFTFTAPYQLDKWIFGDSYLTNYSSARWIYYLHQMGYDYTLINAFPGEDAVEGYADWITALGHGIPKFAIWCLGMNNPDNGSINADWMRVTQQFLDDCSTYNITPVLATIPNVPNINHTYKNAWIKASGYRYIDFAEAVGATEANSTWYSGCLEDGSSRVHPTEDGARLLCMRALADFPEFMQP